jgi:hypothetical protein
MSSISTLIGEKFLRILSAKIDEVELKWGEADGVSLSRTPADQYQYASDMLESIKNEFLSEIETLANSISSKNEPLFFSPESETEDQRAAGLAVYIWLKEALYAGIDIGATYQEHLHGDLANKWLKEKGITE